MKPLLAGIAFFFVRSIVVAQFPHTSKLEIRHGQERPAIQQIVQDDHGLLWLGSDIGLLRTDGERVEAMFRPESAAITALSTYKGDVLAAVDDGTILRCGMDRCDTLVLDQRLTDKRVNDLLIDGKGRIWLGTHGGGILILDPESRMIVQVNGLRDDHVNDLALLPDGNVVAATDQGLSLCSDSIVVRSLGEQEGAPDNLTLCVSATAEGLVWAGTDRSGAFSWDPASNRISVMDSTWAKGKVTAITVNGDVVWVGTRNGAVIVEESAPGGMYEKPAEDDRNMISEMLVDRNGAVWWCNGTEELFRSDAAILFVDQHEGVDMRNARALCSDPLGRIWFATAEGLFHHPVGFAGHQQLQKIPMQIDPRTPIISLEAAEDGTIWAGTFGGGAIRIGVDGTISHFNSSNSAVSDNVLSVKTRGKEVWFATLEGISHYSPDDGSKRHQLPFPGFVFDVLPMPNGSVLAATDGNGILELQANGKGWRTLLEGEGRFYSLVGIGDEAWAAGPGTGFCRVAQERECHHPALPPFDSDLFALAQLNDHLIAFGSTGTLVHDLRNGDAADVTARLGVEGIQAELNAVDTDRDGSLWLATDQGLLRIRPAEWHLSDRIQTTVRAFRSGGTIFDRSRPIVLPHDHDRIAIDLNAIHWVEPGAIRFEYRLLPSDQRGQITRDRQINYSALPPDDYTFQVRAFIGEPSADEEWISIPFTVSAPFWQRPWVIIAAVAALLIITVLIVRARDRRSRERERMEQEKVRFQLEALRSQVDPHFLFNSFNTLMELIETEPSRAVQHVDRLSVFFRNILLVRDKELIEVEEELRLLENYFALEQHRFGKAIDLHLEVDPSDRSALIVPLTLQLLVENSLKHNVATADRPLRIDVRSIDGSITVNNAVQPRISAPRSTGFGLESIQKRYAALTDRPIRIEKSNDRFTVWIPLIEADESAVDRG